MKRCRKVILIFCDKSIVGLISERRHLSSQIDSLESERQDLLNENNRITEESQKLVSFYLVLFVWFLWHTNTI
jgi:hypothetical protein